MYENGADYGLKALAQQQNYGAVNAAPSALQRPVGPATLTDIQNDQIAVAAQSLAVAERILDSLRGSNPKDSGQNGQAMPGGAVDRASLIRDLQNVLLAKLEDIAARL